jgi:hypothetical protein
MEESLAYLAILNSNKVLWGVTMLLLNFGARYVVADLGKTHEAFLSHSITKKIIIMSLFFVATRDIVMSFVLTFAYIIVIDGFMHEKRKFSLVPKRMNETFQQQVSQEDYKKAKTIIEKYENDNKNAEEKHEMDKQTLHLNYMNNLKAMQ